MNFNIENKVVVISGGAGDIGEVIVRNFATQDTRVVIADRDLERAENIAESLASADVSVCRMDITSESDIQSAVASTFKRHGRIDVLVNAAGLLCRKSFFDTTKQDIEALFAVNFTGLFLMSREVGKIMCSQKQGAIINISSMNSKLAVEDRSLYGASKAAINSLTQAMALELAPHGVSVNAVAPGIVDSKMARVRLNTPELIKKYTNCIPLRQMTLPEDVAHSVLFLASPFARNICGEILTIDGGLTARMSLPLPG